MDALSDEEIDLSDCPEITPEMIARGTVRRALKPPPGKQAVTVHLDSDVVEWIKQQGQAYEARINALLRAHMEASKP